MKEKTDYLNYKTFYYRQQESSKRCEEEYSDILGKMGGKIFSSWHPATQNTYDPKQLKD
uniref:Uncharacterized protein n=1 Tax=viral metagenome TaxID=1070528 RepID=A0A6M3X5T5_9ZZZZ